MILQMKSWFSKDTTRNRMKDAQECVKHETLANSISSQVFFGINLRISSPIQNENMLMKHI